jgi:CelD/BcsL family acetyltransferase involved in cellulose biosynthesis
MAAKTGTAPTESSFAYAMSDASLDPVSSRQFPIGTLRTWSEEEFSCSRARWQALLACSSADPLFMSWAWLHSWWQAFASIGDSTLEILAAYSPTGQLVGLAPLHLRRIRHRGVLRGARLESLGSMWRQHSGVFSEYLDFIVKPEYEPAFFQALAAKLDEDRRWDDLVIANSVAGGCAARFVNEYVAGRGYLRKADVLTAHKTQLPLRFDEYVAKLTSSTRRKVWNQRRKLPDPQFSVCPETQVDSFMDALDGFHEGRWGARHFVGRRRTFHRAFVHAMADSGALRMTRLDSGQSTVSLMYNVRLQDTEYNIQSGFGAVSPSGTSPGYLHFGFCLEQACNDGLRYFDFLAGEGRSRDYKNDFITSKTRLATLHVLRARPLAWLYERYDRLRGRAAGN